jgi:hypothetical protein
VIHKLTISEIGGNFLGVEYLQNKIITEINKLRNMYFKQNDFFFESIYMPTSLINIISDSKFFNASIYDSSLYLGEEERPVGILSNMQVYMDHTLKRNQIRISINKSRSRELKIKTILENIEGEKVFEIFIEVDSDLI